MKPYLWMTEFTPQKEWIDGRGILLGLAFFFSEIGAGVYMVSLFQGYWIGCLTGWVSCALLGGGLHLAYLGKPGRAWRAIRRPASSELSRGIIFMGLFLALGAAQLILGLDRSDSLLFKVVLGILAFFVITHGFMTLSCIHALSFWNSGIMPILSLASGLWVGAQMTVALAMMSNSEGLLGTLEPVARWFLFSYILLGVFYFWNARHGSLASKNSFAALWNGELAVIFYPGVVLAAVAGPLLITLYLWGTPLQMSQALLWLRILLVLVGDLALRYCIMKAARYMPLINSNIISGAQLS